MGSNLFYHFTKRRAVGLQLLRSGDAIPNLLTVWTAVALILFNLDRFSAQPRLTPWWFLGLAVVLPLAALGGLYQRQRRQGKPEPKEALRQRDIVSEVVGLYGARNRACLTNRPRRQSIRGTSAPHLSPFLAQHPPPISFQPILEPETDVWLRHLKPLCHLLLAHERRPSIPRAPTASLLQQFPF